MPGKRKPPPEGYVTIHHLAKRSGLKPYTLKVMYTRGDLKGTRESGVSGPTGDRIVIERASAAGLLREIRRARQAEQGLGESYSVAELATKAGVEQTAVTEAIRTSRIKGAEKIRFKRGGVGGHWRIPKKTGDAYAARAIARAAVRRLSDMPTSRLLTMEQLLSELSRQRGIHMSDAYVGEWIDEGELKGFARREESGQYLFHPGAVDKIAVDLFRKKK